MDKVAGLLTQYRLVTVTGPGGSARHGSPTRCSGRSSAGSRTAFWVAELAAVAEPAFVPAMVATVLGVHQAAGVPIMDAVAARLARQQLLLVLDNCEHVLDAVAQFWLGQLCGGAPDFVSVVLDHNSAVVAARKGGPPSPDLVDGLLGRIAALRDMGQLDEAAAEARSALDLARRIGYPAGEARALMKLSEIAMYTRFKLRAPRPHGAAREPSTSPETGRLARCAVR